MFHLRLIIIGFFIVTLLGTFAYSDDCSCAVDEYIYDDPIVTVTHGSSGYDDLKYITAPADELYCYDTYKLVDIGSIVILSDGFYHTKKVRSRYNCVPPPVCESPDQDISPPLDINENLLWSYNCNDTIPITANQECTDAGGITASGSINCCSIIECHVPIIQCEVNQVNIDGTCTECPANSSPTTSTSCGCDLGYLLTGDACIPLLCDDQEYVNPVTGNCDVHDCTLPMVPGSTYVDDGNCVYLDDPPVCVPGFASDSNGICSLDSDLDGIPDTEDPFPNDGGTGDEDCDHAPDSFGYLFQTYTNTTSACNTLSGGNLEYYTISLDNCSLGTHACFYNEEYEIGDINVTENIPTPDDITPDESNMDITSDNNGSFVIDMTAALEKLASIKNNTLITNIKLDTTNTHLGSIGSGVGDLNTKMTGLNTNLSGKLDGIKSAIDNQSSDIDLTETNDILTEMKDEMITDRTEDEESVNSGYVELSTAYDTAFESYNVMFSDMKSTISGLAPPSMSVSGSCGGLSVGIFGGTLDVAEGIDFVLVYIKSLVMLLLNLSFTYIIIKMSILAFSDITKRIQWLFI